ncbi:MULTISPECIES: signal peptidase I [unclassified Bradyrhizobium]|uniref:signal peptidase I n=1 Tax=unclassified Bradyrhizobium TaxID=2631580 RepID=UPI0028E237B4|nr:MULTISPECIES: signal peptidase I [unclassified Bradyrhizobium]
MTSLGAGEIRPLREPWWAIAAIFTAGFVLLCLLLASPLLIRTFLFQPFNIPSASNIPTLLVGDYLLASKYPYGWGRYTWPFTPPSAGRIWGRDPARGDVVVFRLKDGKTDYIKRIVGLPGDRIQMRQGLLYINDQPVQRERLDDLVGEAACGGSADERVKRWRETLPNGVSYQTLDCVDNGFFDNTNVYVVPAGHLFMLGDNRDNSTDSRVLSAVGYVPIENVIGRAATIYFSLAGSDTSRPGRIRFERIGTMVR